MICRHCGARIERATLYGVRPASADGQTIYFADGPSRGCAHEPEDGRVNWRAELVTVTLPKPPQRTWRPATVAYPTGICGEYLPSDE